MRSVQRLKWLGVALPLAAVLAVTTGAIPVSAAPKVASTTYNLYISNAQYPTSGGCSSDEETVTSAVFPPLPPTTKTLTPDGCSSGTPGVTGITFSPDGATAYVADYGQNQITPIDTSTFAAGTSFSSGGTNPVFLQVTPNGGDLIVVDSVSDNVAVISTSHTSSVKTISDTHGPLGVAILPNGSAAYISNTDGTVSVIKLTSTPRLTKTITFPSPGCTGGGDLLAAAPNGKKVYVTCTNGAELWVIKVLHHNQVKEVVHVKVTGQIVITPNGQMAYVNGANGKVFPIDLKTKKVGKGIPVSDDYGLGISPDGAYVAAPVDATSQGAVDLISTSSNAVTSTIQSGGDAPGWVAFQPSIATS